ncbi:hypothetical protein P9112_003585 [Eukaryota sp. TZLM1-RC]
MKLPPLQRKLYENCIMMSPTNEIICRCAYSRLTWYVSRNLAEVVPNPFKDDDSQCFRLLFTPKGNGHSEDFYTSPLQNQCVGCGSTDSLTRHHVVPSEFRQHFPVSFKSRRSHDVLLLCCKCHHYLEGEYTALRRAVFEYYSVPRHVALTRPLPQNRRLVSAARALKKNLGTKNLPQKRVKELQSVLLTNIEIINKESKANQSDLIDDLIDKALKLPVYSYTNAKPSALMVVERVSDYFKFERLWRVFFLIKLKPKFLPSGWRVDIKGID